MHLIESFIRNPVKVTVGVLLVALFGVVALERMPMQLTPEVQTPTITIQTRWPGASPQEIEREITLEQEEQLKSVEGLKKMSSESSDSRSRITLEFLVGTDMDEALLKVNSRLQQVREYPEDADQPVISTANSDDRPIAWFMLSARRSSDEQLAEFQARHPKLASRIQAIRESHSVGLGVFRLRAMAEEHPEVRELLPPDVDVTRMRRFAENEIESRFERVPGISQSSVYGGLEEELQVIVDAEKLAARQITIADMLRVLRGQNKDTSAGDFSEGKRRWVVRTLGQFRDPEDVKNQLLVVQNGAPIHVGDVAEGAVERLDAGSGAGIDHARHGVVPEILLGGRARCVGVVGIGICADDVSGMAAAYAGRLHAAACGEVRWSEGEALHARAGGADLLDVGDAESGFENGVNQEGLLESRTGFKLSQQAVHVVDVPVPFLSSQQHRQRAVFFNINPFNGIHNDA